MLDPVGFLFVEHLDWQRLSKLERDRFVDAGIFDSNAASEGSLMASTFLHLPFTTMRKFFVGTRCDQITSTLRYLHRSPRLATTARYFP